MPSIILPFTGCTMHWPDTRCMRAVEDRNLMLEAANISGQEEALVGTMLALYPGKSLTN